MLSLFPAEIALMSIDCNVILVVCFVAETCFMDVLLHLTVLMSLGLCIQE